MPPGSFIPRSEASDLINELTDWVLDQALHQMRTWMENGFEIPLAVNVSSRTLQIPSFSDRVSSYPTKHDIPSRLLEVEVTERALMRDHIQGIETLQKLSEIPVAIAIDDFGTGYSSLQYLKDIPASAIKIDRSFIRDMATDANTFQVVRAVTKIGKALNMEVVAERVETYEEYDLVKRALIDHVQGYLFHRPVQHEDFFNQLSFAV